MKGKKQYPFGCNNFWWKSFAEQVIWILYGGRLSTTSLSISSLMLHFYHFLPCLFIPISCIDMYRMETKGWICKYEIYKIKNLGWNVWGWSFQAPSVRYMYHQSQMRACGMYCMQVSCVPAGQKKLSLYEIFSCNVVTKKQEKYVFL